jgi:hypothetical protein
MPDLAGETPALPGDRGTGLAQCGPMLRRFIFNIAACAFWLTLIGAGLVLVSHFENTSQASSGQTTRWPADSPVQLAPRGDTLLMFAHPHCPCTKASLQELGRLLQKSRQPIAAHVFFVSPARYPSKWTLTDLWRTAAGIPSVVVHGDPDGAAANQFGAAISGYVLLFNSAGKLVFRGGITTECGRDGNNRGAENLAERLDARNTSLAEAPVFGRPLTEDDASVVAN